MAIDKLHFELFKSGKIFDQVSFLDNFFQDELMKESGPDLAFLLSSAILATSNLFVKRSALKILCVLTITKKIDNHYATLGIIGNFLNEQTDESLQVVALKYLHYFYEANTNDIQEKLKLLSDSPSGEVSSQSYICLGVSSLMSGINKPTAEELVVNLEESMTYFKAAGQSTENRVDAEFYVLFISWIRSILANDQANASIQFDQIKSNLHSRVLYEFDETGLELEFLIFKLLENMRQSLELSGKAYSWTDTRAQIKLLHNLQLETNALITVKSVNQSLIDRLYMNVLTKVEANILRNNLKLEKERLDSLASDDCDGDLKNYIVYLLSLFPDETSNGHDDLQLLSILIETLGAEAGLELYQRIIRKEVTLVQSISDLLRKEKANSLPFRTGSIHGQEILFEIMAKIKNHLPDYPTDKMEAFFNILEETIRYARVSFVDNQKKRFSFLFSQSEGGKGTNALEQDLQDSMILYFEHSKIADGLEHEKAKFVDAGRVDILYKKDLITIPIELKKSLNRPNQLALEQNYIAQAQTYTSGYDQLGIFILLELSDKSNEPPPNFKDWFKIHHLPPSTNQAIAYPDFVVSCIIPGNRTTPSAKSNYK